MCVHPISVKRKFPKDVGRSFLGLDYSSLPPLVRDAINYSAQDCVVPCGKCIECLRARQNALAIRASRVAQRYGSMQFATLTYENHHLPFALSTFKIDKETGEELPCTIGAVVGRDEPIYADLVRSFMQLKPGRKAIRLRHTISNMVFQFTPTINRRDVRLWLKRSRVAYEREHGQKLPDFKYLMVGEYGPNTCRPHYHIAFFGLSYKQALWLCSQWNYGYTLCKDVAAVNEDGTPGFLLAARYISKYVSKGKFDCDTCKDNTAERPRICQSMKMGLLDDNELRYYRCADVFPALDLLRGRYSAGNLSEDDIARLAELVRERSTISIAGNSYKLPAIFIRQIWSIKVYNSDGVKNVCSPLYAALRYLARVNDMEDISNVEISDSLPFYQTSETSLSLRELREEESYRSFLAKSIF